MTDASTLGGFAVPFRNSYSAGDAVTQPLIYDATGSQVGSVRGPWPDPEIAKLAAVLAEAPAMLAALQEIMPYAEEEARALRGMQSNPEEEAFADDVEARIARFRAILARIEGSN